MKVRLGFRSSIIILFMILYISSMFIFYNFYIDKLANINDAFINIKFDSALSELSLKTAENEKLAKDLLIRYHESLACVQAVERETRIYSVIYLFFLVISSLIIFVVIFHFISKPLNELRIAAENIQKGDFSISLEENGFKEIRVLKRSFNSMSKELKNTQNKLLEAEKEIIWKEFSRILAHEIKNPLTPIQLTLQRLEEKFYSDKEKFNKIFHESIKIIDQEIQTLFSLARSFSNFAKNPNPGFSIFHPQTVIKEIVKPYKMKFNIEISGMSKSYIKFDEMHFYQIITNLLQNAIESSEEDNKITINITDSDNQIKIQIKDKGCGIEKKYLNKIFEPYFSRKKKGIGLGLALVKKLVEVNEAEILVKSEIGKGTEFIIIMEKHSENLDN